MLYGLCVTGSAYGEYDFSNKNVNLIRIGKYTNSNEVKMNEVSYLYFLLLLLYINSHLL